MESHIRVEEAITLHGPPCFIRETARKVLLAYPSKTALLEENIAFK